jgi:hypothetical protein
MTTLDPSTNLPLPPDAIQRILFIAASVHVYNIPPLTSTKGYVAKTWTENNNARQIFTARIRIVETAIPNDAGGEAVTTAVVLEDPKTGDLFAAAPYTSMTVVEQVLDSSRFFAVRVQGEGGRKAVLGIGFEERSEAFDFSVALQEVRKTLGFEPGQGAAGAGAKRGGKAEIKKDEIKRDFSLKEGETITVNIGGIKKGRRSGGDNDAFGGSLGAFSLPPPPSGGGGGSGLLPPPPSAQAVKQAKRLSQTFSAPAKGSIEDLGFDDGEFGEFQ